MRTTKVTMPDGSVYKAQTKSSNGFCAWFFLGLFVLAAPASFPLPWSIFAYMLLAVVGIAAAVQWQEKHGVIVKKAPVQRAAPLTPPPPPPPPPTPA